MLGAAGVQRVGDETGIVDRLEGDAVTGERHHVELGVLHDLEDALIFQDRLQQIERQTDRNLRHRLAAEIESLRGAVRERHIGRVPGY